MLLAFIILAGIVILLAFTISASKQQLLATTDLRIGSIVLQSKALANADPQQLEDIISETLKTEGQELFNFTPEVEQWQNRVLSLRIWNPEQNLPDGCTPSLLADNKVMLASTFLAQALQGLRQETQYSSRQTTSKK